MVYQFDFQRQSPNTGFAFFLLLKTNVIVWLAFLICCAAKSSLFSFLNFPMFDKTVFFRQAARAEVQSTSIRRKLSFIVFAGLNRKTRLTKPDTALKIGRKRQQFPFPPKDTVFFADRKANAGEKAKFFGRHK